MRGMALLLLLLCTAAGYAAGLTAPAELVSFPVEPGKFYRVKAILDKSTPGSEVGIRFCDHAGKPVEIVEKSLGRPSSTRLAAVGKDGTVTLEAVAGSGPAIPAVRAVLFLNSGRAEKLLRLDFAADAVQGDSAGVRNVETPELFARNMIVNPSFEKGQGTLVDGWRFVGDGTPRIGKETFSGSRALLLTPADEKGCWETVEPVPLKGNAPLWVGYWTKFNRYATIYGHPDILRPQFLKRDSNGTFVRIPYNRFHEFNLFVYKPFYGTWSFIFSHPYIIPAGATHVRFYTHNRNDHRRHTGVVKANFGNIILDNVMAFQAARPNLPGGRPHPYELFTALRPEGKLPPAVVPGSRTENTVWLGAALSDSGNLFFKNQKSGLKPEIRVNNLLPVSRNIEVSGRISDARGKAFGTVSAKVKVPGNGMERIVLPVPAKLPFGVYIIECTAKENGKTAGNGQLRFANLEQPSRVTAQEKSSSEYHFDLHPSIRWWLTPKKHEMTPEYVREAKIMQFLGVNGIRIQTHYPQIDVRNHQDTISKAEQMVESWNKFFVPLLKEHGLTAYISLMEQGGVLRVPASPAEWNTWREFHTILARGLAPAVQFMLYGNEGLGGYTAGIPDDKKLAAVSHFVGNTREWFAMYREAYRGAKAGAPELVFGPSHASDDGGLIAKRFLASAESGKEFDCWGVNAYQDSPGICRNVFKNLAPGKKKFGVVPEVGLSVPDRGKDRLEGERRQAEYVPQVYLRLLAEVPFFKHITFFITMYHQYGIFDSNWQPRPAAGAYAVMTDRLGAGNVEKREQLPGGELYFWRRSNGQLIGVGWSTRPQFVFLETDADSLTVDDLYGNHRKVSVVNGIAKITLDREPIYILGAKKLQISRTMELSGQIALRNGEPGVLVTVGNQTGEPQRMDVELKAHQLIKVTPLKQTATVPAKGKQQLFFRTEALLQDDRKPLEFRISAARGDGLCMESIFRHPFALCQPGNGTGNSWEYAMPLHADRREQVELFVTGNRWNGPQDLSAVIKSLYDSKNLYLQILVKDDKMTASSRKDRIFQYDGCELGFLIPRNGKLEFYQFAAGLTPDGAALYQHMPVDLEGERKLPADALKIVRDEKSKTTLYTIALPWKLLNNFKPAPGGELHFGAFVDDSDGNPPHDRKAVGWYGLGIHERRFSDFGILIFTEKAGKVSGRKNMVKNPTFQDGKTHWRTHVRAGQNGEKPQVDFEIVSAGVDDNAAARINSPKGGGKAIAEFNQLLPVKPDCEYYVSADVKVVRAGSWQAAYVEHQDEKRRLIGYNYLKMSADVKKQPPHEWRRQECTFRTRPNQRFVSISLRLQHLGSGEVLYDNIEVVEIGK